MITEFKYDPAGRVIERVSLQHGGGLENSRKIEIIYDSLGREAKKKVWFDVGTTDYSLEYFEYDLLGNIIEKCIKDSEGNTLLIQRFAYDDAGRCIEESSMKNKQKQVRIATSYDSSAEPTSYSDGLGNTTQIAIDHSNNAVAKTITNPLGVVTNMQFDALGRVTMITKKDSNGTLLSLVENLYDALGNRCVEKHAVVINGRQVDTRKTRWIYGPMNHLEQLIEAEGSDEEKTTFYTYNHLGKIKEQQLPGAKKPLNYTYDKYGRLTRIDYSEDKTLLLSNSFCFDNRGNITSASTQEGCKITRDFNAFNQITKEKIDDGQGQYTQQFQYDRLGRLKTITLPDLSSINYTYDAVFGREVSRISSIGKQLYSHTYNEYDLSGQLTEDTLIGYCGDRAISYDAGGHINSITTDMHSEIVPDQGYTPMGHILSVQKESEFPSENSDYAYNDLSQLISENNQIQKTYSYDSLHNRVNEDQQALIYNTLNQLTHRSDLDYTYDSQGNLQKKIQDGEETQFENNILGQLVNIQRSAGTSLQFSYDPFGRRLIQKNAQGQVRRTFYYNHQVLGFLNNKRTIDKLHVPGISGNTISLKSVAIEIQNQPYAPLHDISGNICALLDPEEGEIIESYSYTAFGIEKIYNEFQEEVDISEVGNPWRYADKPINEETGLIYFGLRDYDPLIGRWTSPDPLGYIESPNLYVYCNNTPTNTFDRLGLQAETNSSKMEEYFFGEVEYHCYCEHHRTCKRGGDLANIDGSKLPYITYNNKFEQLFPKYNQSKLFDLGLKETENIGIGYINGIWSDFSIAYQNTQYISNLAQGLNVHCVYNATHGHREDLIECSMGLKYIATKPVKQLHAMWDNYFEKSSNAAQFLMICHSQGVLHVRNALLDYPPELRDRISVVAIAPAAYVYEQTCAAVTHFRAANPVRDFVPRIDVAGARREQSTITDLASHSDAGQFDHFFQSPTYKQEMQLKIELFLQGANL